VRDPKPGVWYGFGRDAGAYAHIPLEPESNPGAVSYDSRVSGAR